MAKKIVPPYKLSDFNLEDRLIHDDDTVVNLITAIEFLLQKENERAESKVNPDLDLESYENRGI